MVLSELLYSLGLSGSIVTVVVAIVGLKHGREILALFATLGLVTRVVGLVLFAFVLLSSGLVPGISVSVDANLSLLGGLLADLLDLVVSLLRSVV